MKGRYEVADLITAAVQTAKRAGGGKTLTALDMGPIGDFMEPVGTLKFGEAYELFREQAVAGAAAGADLVAIETMSDLSEVKAAILAVKEHTNLPVFVTMTFGKNGRTLTGGLPESFALMAQGLGAAAVGINCSLGPADIFPIAERLAKYTDLPLIIKPNAGLPNGKTGKYDIGPDEFAGQMVPFASIGAKVVGGCCGTTPEYIEKLCAAYKTLEPAQRKKVSGRLICSPTKTVNIDRMPIPDPGNARRRTTTLCTAQFPRRRRQRNLMPEMPESWKPEISERPSGKSAPRPESLCTLSRPILSA
jgi:5-methyltetrahydrofolate--homocysteine methyltransferase